MTREGELEDLEPRGDCDEPGCTKRHCRYCSLPLEDPAYADCERPDRHRRHPRWSQRRHSGPVVVAGGEVREVKDLGWLLRHGRDVERFEIFTCGDQTSETDNWGGAYLVAHLSGGRRYESPHSSQTRLEKWVRRRVFRGAPVDYPDSVRRATAPHARCTYAGRCVEHEQDSSVEPCARWAGGRGRR